MSYSQVAADRSPDGEAASSDNARLLQIAMKAMQWCVDNATDETGITAASKTAAVVNLLSALGVSSKQDLKQVGGTSLASKVVGELNIAEQQSVENALT